jgi:caspase domain-containing protein
MMKANRFLASGAVAVIFILQLCALTASGQTPDTTRQLQQLPSVNTLPSKAKRWALIIGVDKYVDPQISPLKGADNDARLMADALVRYAGFPQDQVILLSTDQPTERQPTRVNILRRLSNLSSAVPKDGLLLISFAGHGMERSGQAFLLPSDAQISDQISFLSETAINVNRIKEQIKEIGVSQVIVMLDACRNDPGGRADAPNPLTNTYTSAFNFDVRNREVQAFATLYATAIGQRAYEYTEKKQGYFSWAVINALKGDAANDKGEVTLSQLVKYVQEAVPKRITIDLGSTKQQRPFAVIEGFRAEELVVAVTNSASNAAATTMPNVSVVDPAAIELSFWDAIKNSSNPEDYKAYLDKYPDGQFASIAKLRAQPARQTSSGTDSGSMEMAYWNAIKDSKNSSDFKAYQTKFPNGFFFDLAASRIATLDAEAREREKARLASEALQVDDTIWLGQVMTGKPEEKHDVKLEFMKGGIFSGTYQYVVTIPGFLINDYKSETVKLSGTWRQTDDVVSVQLSQPTIETMKLTVGQQSMQGASDQGNYKFTVEKILKKSLTTSGVQAAGGCDFHGFKVKIIYRKKDKVDRTQDATKLQERLRSYGIEVELEKYNWKDYGTGLSYYNGQGEIADKLAACINDIFPLKVTDGKVSSIANQFIIYLQQ